MVGFLIAVLSGVLMSVQGIFNTQVTKASSIWSANVFVPVSYTHLTLPTNSLV